MTSYQCQECRNYKGELKCKAFPNKIPDEILTGAFNHNEPHKGDNGIQFEAIKK